MRHKTLMLATAVAVVVSMLGHAADAHAAPAGKPRAPVEISANLESSKATLTITFETAAEEVNVRVYGTDGLAVSGTRTPVINGSFAAGQVLKLAVGYSAGPGQSNLAVQVNGRFEGRQRSKISSFTLGDTRVAGRAATVVDDQGRRIVVLPAQDR